MAEVSEHPLRPLCAAWCSLVRIAREHKKKKFQDSADECMSFFNGPHTFMWKSENMTGARGYVRVSDEDEENIRPTFLFTMNKIAEGVQLFGPALYSRNPNRLVTPRKSPQLPPEVLVPPPEPAQMMGLPPEMVQQAAADWQMQVQAMLQETAKHDGENQARAELMQGWLNYTPNELDLKWHSRKAIDEAIIKGAGVLWTELADLPARGGKIAGSFYRSVDSLFLDPDVETVPDCKWVCEECTHPIWEVEDYFRLPRDMLKDALKGNDRGFESLSRQASVASSDNGLDERSRGRTNDTITYYKFYSKMGIGDRLSGVDPEIRDKLAAFGDNCYLAVADGIPWPLNLPDQVWEAMPQPDPLTSEADPAAMEAWQQELLTRVQWPIPFWADGRWPFTMIAFHEVPNCVWPMSHFEPGLGELKWLNWAMSFLAGKVRTSCKTTIGMMKAAGEDLKQQYLNSGDNAVLMIEEITGRRVDDLISFIQQPPFHGDIYNVIAAVADSFEKRVGLTELAYGQSGHQYRSAAEANVKQGNFSIRPDDMASQVEDAMTEVARKEALAARWLLQQEDVAPVLGRPAAAVWGRLIQAAEMESIIAELDYRIEAGSARKPNKTARIEQMNTAVQTWGPTLQQYAFTTGDVRPLNALLIDWAKALDIDPVNYLLQPPPPPPPPDAQMQQDQQAQEAQQGRDGQKHEQGIRMREEAHQQKMRHADESQKAKRETAGANGTQ